MQVDVAGQLTSADLTDATGTLLLRPTVQLSPTEAQMIRHVAKMLRAKRFRMLVRCDACFEAGRPDGMRGVISAPAIKLECRCRYISFEGATL